MTPEAALFVAVIEQAIRDLDDPDATIRREAKDFFFAGGAHAKVRTFFFDALGVNVTRVQENLRRVGKDKAPPALRHRSFNPFSSDDLLALIPKESAFQLADLRCHDDVSQAIKQARLTVLIKQGVVETVGHGWYALTAIKHPQMLTNKERVLSILGDQPMTAKEISRCLRPAISQIAVRDLCNTLVAQGLAVKFAPGVFRLRDPERIAA